MKLLVVEGNPRSVWESRESQGAVPYHQRFLKLLAKLGYSNVDIAFPAEKSGLPDSNEMTHYNGVLLTGSSLNIYDDIDEVNSQLDFANHCFSSGVPIYGSCWGLQVAVMVAGGKIGRGKSGREFGIAENVSLTEAGKSSQYFRGKTTVFDAYCIHEDDTHVLPDNTEVLASNGHSDIQALQLNYQKSDFFGVQYHPEFVYDDALFLANLMEDKFYAEGILSDEKTKSQYLKQMKEHATINNVDFHALEIVNWLKAIDA